MKRIGRLVLIALGVLVGFCLLGSLAKPNKNATTAEPPSSKAKASIAEAPTKEASKPVEPDPPPSSSPATPTPPGKWDDPTFVRFAVANEKCPDNFWAVLKVPAPGEDEFERKPNEAKRAELAKSIRATTYVAELSEFELSEYDFKKQQFVLSVNSVFSCKVYGIIYTSVALAPAKVKQDRTGLGPGDDSVAGRFEWKAEPLRFALKVPEAQAKRFRDDDPVTVEVAFKVVGADENKVILRNEFKEDVGAGPVVKTTVLGVRVGTVDDKPPFVDTLPEPRK